MQAPFADPLSGIELASRSLPLVGREDEMQLLCNLLDTVEPGRPSGARALILSGDVGIGKTRLLAEMRHEASRRGFRLLDGRAYEVGSLFPYLSFTEALRPIIRASSVGAMRALVGLDSGEPGDTQPGMQQDAAHAGVSISLIGTPMVAALARLFPELPQKLKVTLVAEPLSPDQEKFRLFDAIATLLERMAEERPLMLSIDNLQWADSASLELTMYLTVRLHASRVALVGVTRPIGSGSSLSQANSERESESIDDSQDQAAKALQMLGELMRQGLLLFLPVRPHSIESAERHLQTLLPGEIYGAESLLMRAEGNPFFLEELIRMLTLNGQLTQRDGVWDMTRTSGTELPASIALAVEQRLRVVRRACLEAMRVAALFGRTFPLAALALVTEESESHMQEIIDEAVRASLIAPLLRPASFDWDEDVEGDEGPSLQSAPPISYFFCQGIVQEVLSGEIPGRRASMLHGKIGEALETYYRRYALQAPAAELARHYTLSGEHAAALRWSLRAGQDAARQQAHREATGHFRTALKLMEANIRIPDMDNSPSMAQVRLLIGESWFKIGELNPAAKSFQKALEQVQHEKTLPAQLAASIAAQANRMVADVYRMQGQYELALAHLQAARNIVDAAGNQPGTPGMRLSSAEQILLLQAQATMSLLLNRAEESEKALWQSYQLATEIGDRGGQAFSLHLVGWIRGWGEHIHEAIRLQEQAHELYVAIGDPFRAALGDQGLGIIYQALGEMEKSRLHNLRGFEMARRYGVRHILGWLHWNLGVMALAEGNWAECESRMQQSLQEAEATSNQRLKPIIAQVQAELAFRKGDWQVAEQHFQASISAAVNTEWYPSAQALYGHFLAVTGRHTEAKTQLEQAAALQEPVGYSGHYYVPFLAEGFLHTGAAEQATGYIERIKKLRGFMYYGVAVDRIRGEVAALSGNWEEAERAFDDGLKLCRRVKNQPEEGTILYEQARTILMRTGKQDVYTPQLSEKIQQLCQAARSIFSRFGMQRAINMVDTLQEGMRQLGVKTMHPAPQATSKIVEGQSVPMGYILDQHLTRRELDVLRLVAEGQTDREVADALVISPRTVNRHLGNIFVKLDVPGRAAAVAYAIRQGLVS